MRVIRLKGSLAGTVSIIGLVLLFLFPKQAKTGAAAGLSLAAQVLIPSLFTFMVLALFLSKSGALSLFEAPLGSITRRLFRCNHAVAILLGFVGGFPLGGQLIGDAYRRGALTADEANARLSCGINAGPAFIITAVGTGMLGSRTAGVVLFVSITAASIVNGVLFSRILIKAVPQHRAEQPGGIGVTRGFVASVSDSANAMLRIAGYTVFFSTLIYIIKEIGLNANVFRIVGAVLEVTTGVALLKEAPLSLIAAVIAFGGVSVHTQVLSALRDVPVHMGLFYLSRLTHALLSAAITRLLLWIVPISVPAVVRVGTLGSVSAFSLPLTLAMMLMSVTLIISTQEEKIKK